MHRQHCLWALSPFLNKGKETFVLPNLHPFPRIAPKHISFRPWPPWRHHAAEIQRIGVKGQGLVQPLQKLMPGDLASAHSEHMRGSLLAIYEQKTLLAEQRHQTRESRAGGLRPSMEHGFSEKGAAQGNAIDSARKAAIRPGFHGMGIAQFMQFSVGPGHVRRYPGAALPLAGGGALPDHIGEAFVPCQIKGMVFEIAAAPGWQAELMREKDATRIRRPPEDGIARIEPGKDALAVGAKQGIRLQIQSVAQNTFRRRGIRIRKLRRHTKIFFKNCRRQGC